MPIFEISSQNGCLFLKGAYFHGVLISACNILVARGCVGDGIALHILGLEVHFCPTFIAFLQPELYKGGCGHQGANSAIYSEDMCAPVQYAYCKARCNIHIALWRMCTLV